MKKIFVFGDLSFKTANSITGKAEWWFHVALAAKFDDQIYVFDPAINPNQILLLEDWASSFNLPLADLDLALCHRDTYIPYDSCDQPQRVNQKEFARVQNTYLFLEWLNIVSLGRNPLLELQEYPPWRQPIYAWRYNRKGMIGNIYINYNESTKEIEYFKLINLDSWGRYDKFPSDKQNNFYWEYIGNTLPFGYLQKPKRVDDERLRYKIGDVFVHENSYLAETEYYMLAATLSDGGLARFPANQQDNYYWKFLGNTYPIQLKGNPHTSAVR